MSIIMVFKETDPEIIPVFVARDLQKLPPITFDHVDVTNLLKNILTLQSDMKYVKENYATIKLVEDMCNGSDNLNNPHNLEHSPIENSQSNINRQRGAYILEDSSYMEMYVSNSHSEEMNKRQNINSNFENVGLKTADPVNNKQSAYQYTGASSPHAVTRRTNANSSVSLAQATASEGRVEDPSDTAVSTKKETAMLPSEQTKPACEARMHVQIPVVQGNSANMEAERCTGATERSWANIAQEGGPWKQVSVLRACVKWRILWLYRRRGYCPTKYRCLVTLMRTLAILVVFTIFWGLYSYDRRLIFPEFLDAVIPPISNHVIHTMIVPVVVCEVVLRPRKEPENHARNVSQLTLHLCVYFSVLYFTYIERGIWLYPIFKKLFGTIYFVFAIAAIAALFYIFYYIQWPITNMIHGSKKKVEKKKAKLEKKVK
ncbi:hypothetical protein B5X24_HaOG203742 [Helicoverpa armigera]|nr:hypothetical protein B5X24_HaOG203742 [Helicoverpa armigera]